MAPRSTGYFAGFDLENGENVRRLVVAINAVARSKAFSPLLTDRQRISVQLLIQAMATSPLINTIIRSQLLKLGPFAPEAALAKVGRLLDSYVVASSGTPGTAAYADAQRAWETRQPLQASINIQANTSIRPPIQPQFRGQVIDDDDEDESEAEEESPKIRTPRTYKVRTSRNYNTTGEQSFFSAASRQIESDLEIALKLAAMEAAEKGVDPEDREKVVETQMGAQVSAVYRRLEPKSSFELVLRKTVKASSDIDAAKPTKSASEDASKVAKKPGDRSAGPGSKQPWLRSEKALVLELVTEHSKKYRQPKFARLTNTYNDRMNRSGLKQGKGEQLLCGGNHKFLGRERVVPWRTKAAMMKAVKTWPEYTIITDSALPVYDLSTQTETDPLAGMPGADDASDDEEYPPPPVTNDASAYTLRGRKDTKRPIDSDKEFNDADEVPKKKKKRKTPCRGSKGVKKKPPRTDDNGEDGRSGDLKGGTNLTVRGGKDSS